CSFPEIASVYGRSPPPPFHWLRAYLQLRDRRLRQAPRTDAPPLDIYPPLPCRRVLLLFLPLRLHSATSHRPRRQSKGRSHQSLMYHPVFLHCCHSFRLLKRKSPCISPGSVRSNRKSFLQTLQNPTAAG